MKSQTMTKPIYLPTPVYQGESRVSNANSPEDTWKEATAFIQDLKGVLEINHRRSKSYNQKIDWWVVKKTISEERARDLHQSYPTLDEGVENILIALTAHGFRTWGSCRGHPERIRDKVTRELKGYFYRGDPILVDYLPAFPWVHMDSRVVPNWAYAYTEISNLLKEFYSGRPNVETNVHLIAIDDYPTIINKGPHNFETLQHLDTKGLQNQVKICQKEFDDFAEFLKNKLFQIEAEEMI